MSLLTVPRKVRIGLERIQRDLLRGDLREKRKMYFDKLARCKDKKNGGLGLRRLEGLIQALLGKGL